MAPRGRSHLGLVARSAEPGLIWREKVGGGNGGDPEGTRGGLGEQEGQRWGAARWELGLGRQGVLGTRGVDGLSHLTGVPPSDRCPPPPVVPAMASSSPQSQPTIGFPRTRSARRLAAPSAKSNPDVPSLRPSPRSRASGPADSGQATSDARSGRATAQPLSPRKRLGEFLCRDPPGMAGGPIPLLTPGRQMGPAPSGSGPAVFTPLPSFWEEELLPRAFWGR